MQSTTSLPCTVVTYGTFPWWDLPAILSWYHRIYPSPSPPVSLSSLQYYQLLRHTLSLPSSMWLLTPHASPIVLPKNLYPANTPPIPLYTRISYLDFQADIMELRLHPRTINELRRAYDYFLDKSYALRMYNPSLKTALRGRFLYRLESWVEKIGCEGIKAASGDDLGCGDLGGWCEGMIKWEAEEVEKLKSEKEGKIGQPKRFITEGEQAVIDRYTEIMGVSWGEKKKGRKEREGSQKKKQVGVVEYVKAGFVPCLEEAQDIWRMTFKIPEGWVWASYPELSLIQSPGKQTPATACLKEKFPELCQALGVATPIAGNSANKIRGGKVCSPAPIRERSSSIDGKHVYTRQEGTSASEVLGKRNICEINMGGMCRTDVESRLPGSMTTYQAGTEWHPRVRDKKEPEAKVDEWDDWMGFWAGSCSGDCTTCGGIDEGKGTPSISGKRVKISNDEDEGETLMDLDSPRASVSALDKISPIQPLPKTEAASSTLAFRGGHPHSAGQKSGPAPAAPAHSPADTVDTRVLTAPWNRQIQVIQKQHQGLPSPRIPPLLYSPLSYMKHRKRRLEARNIVSVLQEATREQTNAPQQHVRPVAPKAPEESRTSMEQPPYSLDWYEAPLDVEWIQDGKEYGSIRRGNREEPIPISSSPLLPEAQPQKAEQPQQPQQGLPTPPADEEGKDASSCSSSPFLLLSSSPVAAGHTYY